MSDSVGKVSLDVELGGDLNKQLGGVARQTGMSFSNALKASMQSFVKGIKASKPVIIPPPKIDVGAMNAEVEQLTPVLDNINAKLDFQHRKLANLKASYENTFNEVRRTKIEGQILNTESAILSLTKRSDATAQKIWKLEDSIKDASNAAQQATQPVGKLNQSLNNTGKQLKSARTDFNKAAKAAMGTNRVFAIAGKSAGKMGNQFTDAFKRIAKQVLVFAVIYKAIRGLQNYMGSSLKTNNEFTQSLNAIKTNLATAFQPIFNAVLPAINAFMKGLAKITAYIAAFISSLFGKSYKQSFEAAKGIESAKKAMEGYGKAAKKAAGQLQSFDEVNTLDTSKDEGAGAGSEGWQMEMPEMDISGIQTKMDELTAGMKATFDSAWQGIKDGWDWTVKTFGPSFAKAWESISPELKKWKDAFKQTFDEIVKLGEPIKNWWNDHVIPFWQKSITIAGKIVAGLLDSLRIIFESFRDTVLPIWQWFTEKGLPILIEFLDGAVSILYKLFTTVKKIFDDIWGGVVDPVMKLVSKIIIETLDLLKELWDTWGVDIVEGIQESLDKIKELWDNLWENFLKPFIENMLDMLTWLWEKHLKGLIQEIGNFVGKLISAAIDIFNKFVMPIINWLIEKLGPIFADIFSFIGDVIGTALAVIIDVAKGIIKALGGIIEFIAGVFTADWKRAWEGIKTFLGGIGDALVGIFKGAINLIIDALNFFIRQANKVSFDIPDWVPGLGGKSFGLSIPEIPKLAKGGLVHGPTLAMVGDNRGASVDPEVVSPLSKLQEMLGQSNQGVVEVLLMILTALEQQRNQGSSSDTVIQLDGTTVGRLIKPHIDQENQRIGSSMFVQNV